MEVMALEHLMRIISVTASRRTLVRALGLAAIALPGLAATKKKGGKTKTVTKSFANAGTIAIPAVGSPGDSGPANPYPATIVATGFKSNARIGDVNLTVHGLSHGFAHDLFILLVAPGGHNAVVMGEAGINGFESATDDLTLTLDDEADAALPVDEPFTSGTFRPLNTSELDLQLIFPAPAPTPSDDVALSTFDGINPNGEWQLFIVDNGGGSVGSLVDGWSLEIMAKSKAKHKRKKRH
jgi:subtilisin-like proprotein convertase family protein